MASTQDVWSDVWLKNQIEPLPGDYFMLQDVTDENVQLAPSWEILKVCDVPS